MKKLITLILAASMISLSANMPVAYADETASENSDAVSVILYEDFSSMTDGEVLRGSSNLDSSLGVVDNAQTKGAFTAMAEGENIFARMSASLGAASGCRLQKNIASEHYPFITISYKTRTSSSSGSGLYLLRSSTSSASVHLYTAPASASWTTVRIDIDTYNSVINIYEGDTLKKTVTQVTYGEEVMTVHDFILGYSDNLAIRFTPETPKGYWTDFDDLSITSRGKYVDSKNTQIFFKESFSDYTVGDAIDTSPASQWSSYVLGGGSFTFTAVADPINSSNISGAFAGTDRTSSPRVHKDFDIGGYTKFSIEAVVAPCTGTSAGIAIYKKGEASAIASLTASTSAGASPAWHIIRIDIDLENNTYSTHRDGTTVATGTFDAITTTEFTLRVYANGIGSASTVTYFDNIIVCADSQLYNEDGTMNLAAFTYELPSGTVSMQSVLKQSHPRVMITDFSSVYQKIHTDGLINYKYEQIYSNAKSYTYNSDGTIKEPTQYNCYQRPGSYKTCLTTARKVEDVSTVTAFVYNIEKERIAAGEATQEYLDGRGFTVAKYGSQQSALAAWTNYVEGFKTRAVNEMINTGTAEYTAGTFDPIDDDGNSTNGTWLPETMICMSELANGVATAYDWLYNYIDDSTKASILQILSDNAVVPYIKAYSGDEYTSNVTGQNNRTVVNAGSTVSVASAMFDLYPQVAEYLIQGVTEAMYYGMLPYQYSGSFPEGPGYWSYSTNFFAIGQSGLLSMIDPSKEVPQYAKLYENLAGVDQAGDYYIGLNGNVGAFNFCDAGVDYGSTPALFYLADLYNRKDYYTFNVMVAANSTSTTYYGICDIIWMDPTLFDAESITSLKLDNVYDDAYTSSNKNVVYNGATFRSSFDFDNGIYAGIQGGSNGSSHGYYSNGTFILEANSKRWAKMNARHDYDDKYYYYNRRTEGQNTVVVNPSSNGANQLKSAYSAVTEHKETDGTAYALMNMTQNYSELTSATRGLMLTDNRSKVILQDEYTASTASEFYWFLHTSAAEDDIEISSDGKSALLTIGDERMWLRLTDIENKGLTFAKMAALPLADEADWLDGEDENVYVDPTAEVKVPKYGYKLYIRQPSSTTFKVMVEFIALKEGQAAPTSSQVLYAPMSSWGTTDFDQYYASGTVTDTIDTSWYNEENTDFEISDAADLLGLASLVNSGTSFAGKTVSLTADIDLSGLNNTYTPVGTPENPFKGTFNGKGHTIKNFNAYTEQSFFGFFGAVEDATIYNLNLKNVDISGGIVCGSLAAYAKNTSIYSVNVSGKVISSAYGGGLVGITEGGSIKNCSVIVNMDGKPIVSSGYRGGKYQGGITAYANSGALIENCYQKGSMLNLSAERQLSSMLVGFSSVATIKNCYYSYSSSDPKRDIFPKSVFTKENVLQYNQSTGTVYDSQCYTYELLNKWSVANSYASWSSSNLSPTVLLPVEYKTNISGNFNYSNVSYSNSTLTFTAANTASEVGSTNTVIALYSGNKCVGVKYMTTELSASSSQVFKVDLSEYSGFDTIKIFPWADFTAMSVNGNVVEYNVN